MYCLKQRVRCFLLVCCRARVRQSLFTPHRRIPRGSSTRQKKQTTSRFRPSATTRDNRRSEDCAGYIIFEWPQPVLCSWRIRRCKSQAYIQQHAVTACLLWPSFPRHIASHIDIPVSTYTEQTPLSLSIAACLARPDFQRPHQVTLRSRSSLSLSHPWIGAIHHIEKPAVHSMCRRRRTRHTTTLLHCKS